MQSQSIVAAVAFVRPNENPRNTKTASVVSITEAAAIAAGRDPESAAELAELLDLRMIPNNSAPKRTPKYPAGDIRSLPFVTVLKPRGTGLCYWNPGPVPEGMTPSEHGVWLGAAYVDFVRLNSLTNRYVSAELQFVMRDLTYGYEARKGPDGTYEREIAFVGFLSAFLLAGIRTVSNSQINDYAVRVIEKKRELEGEAELSRMRNSFHLSRN